MNEDITFDLNKFKAVICHIIAKCGDNVSQEVLYKLLYFSDFNHYEIFEKPITGEAYLKRPQGQVPVHFIPAFEELKKEGKISAVNDKFFTLTHPEFGSLSFGEKDLIDEVVGGLSSMDSFEISEYCRGDLPWRLARDDGELNYEAVFYREPDYCVRKYCV